MIGEIAVLCYMPQPFTVRSQKLSQLLRLERSVFINIVQSHPQDGQRIVDNLFQVGANLVWLAWLIHCFLMLGLGVARLITYMGVAIDKSIVLPPLSF